MFQPLNNNIYIETEEPVKISAGGIIFVGQQSSIMYGKVIGAGENVSLDLNDGDRVAYLDYTAIRIDDTHIVVDADKLLGVDNK